MMHPVLPCVRQWALVTLLVLVCLPAQAADESTSDKAKQTWQLLDYLAVDYGGAVRDGKVESAPEYAEMQEFAAT
ncbi:MAG: iron permease, partial [Burkholderiales bacterium]